MRRLYLEIPHLYPKIEIVCEDVKVSRYLCYLFSPYIFQHPKKEIKYSRLMFVRNENGELTVASSELKEVLNEGIVSFLQKYLLENSYTEGGFLTLHGACMIYENKAMIFLADSMIGKSTLSAFLYHKGFGYVTDDRVIVDTNKKVVIPFPKPIMLRPGGKEVLMKRYELDIETMQFKCGRIFRELLITNVSYNEVIPVKRIYVLSRNEKCDLVESEIKRENRMDKFLKYNLSIKDLKKTTEIMQLSEIYMKEICFSDLNEMYNFLKKDVSEEGKTFK